MAQYAVMLIALILASPLWKSTRGITLLVLGLIAPHVFLIASIAITLVLFFAEPQPMHLLDMGTTSRWLLDILYRSLVAPPGMAYAVPTLLWLVLLWLIPDDRGANACGLTARANFDLACASLCSPRCCS